VLCTSRFRTRALVKVKFGASVGVRVRFRSEIIKLCMCNFEIAYHILQMAKIDKSHTT